MSLFNSWLSKKTPESAAADASASDWGRHTTAPASLPSSDLNASNRKIQRMERRETLYGVVREVMIRSGVLAASYRFRVLSLDAGGRQYMIMMDIAQEMGEHTQRLVELEKLLMEAARTRDDLDVTAVYWRINEQISGPSQRTRDTTETDAVAHAKDSRERAENIGTTDGRSAAKPLSPLGEEVAQFRQALASGLAPGQSDRQKAPKTTKPKSIRQSPPDFAATQMLDPDELDMPRQDFAATQMLDENEMQRMQRGKTQSGSKK